MMTNGVQPIHAGLLDQLLAQAQQSPRRRAIHCLHRGDWEHAHRMLNALTPATYVCPHQHADPYKGEGFVLLRGKLAVLIFADDGSLLRDASCVLSQDTGLIGMEVPPGVWHTLVALEDSVIYEVKGQPAGGYVQTSDKTFAPWAPPETLPLTSAAQDYQQTLQSLAGQLV